MVWWADLNAQHTHTQSQQRHIPPQGARDHTSRSPTHAGRAACRGAGEEHTRSASLHRLTRRRMCLRSAGERILSGHAQTNTRGPGFLDRVHPHALNADGSATRRVGAAFELAHTEETASRRPLGFFLCSRSIHSGELAELRGVWEKFRQRGRLRACVAAAQSSSAFEWLGSDRPLRCLLTIPI